MDIDIEDACVNMAEETEPEKRKVQELGRVDVPDGMLKDIGLSKGDSVMVTVNKDEGKVEIHPFSDFIGESLD